MSKWKNFKNSINVEQRINHVVSYFIGFDLRKEGLRVLYFLGILLVFLLSNKFKKLKFCFISNHNYPKKMHVFE
jgi:hypothetical protein